MRAILFGFLIGLANIIPGVSGGTVALVLGIYKRLIDALHNIGLRTALCSLRVLTGKPAARQEFVAEMKRIDFGFLALLFIGVIVALASTSRLMEFLLQEHHEATYGFFFGLIVASLVFPYGYLQRKAWPEWLSCAVAVVLTVMLSMGMTEDEAIAAAEKKAQVELAESAAGADEEAGLVSMAAPPAGQLVKLGACGAVAVSAMILPGISGSFILLLTGVYFDVLQAINERQLVVLAVVGLGCVLGLMLFVRLLNWILNRWYNPTIAFMLGLMLGSLNALWPFKRAVVVGGQTEYFGNIWPQSLGTLEVTVLVAFVVAVALIAVFYVLDRRTGDRAALV